MIVADTSVAIPLLSTSHTAHAAAVRWWAGRPITLADHAVVETYSVLTRLPGDARLAPADAAKLIARRFEPPVLLTPETRAALPSLLAELGIAGGAVYDALVGLAAAQQGAILATRDARARLTYERVGARVEVVA